MNYVFTLVHGTFARKSAKWVTADSKFSQALAAQLAPNPVSIHSFSWSGSNSAEARRTAAGQLTNHLAKLIHVNPEAKHFVVGHSHGGTISLKAVHALPDEERCRIAGVCCMSTPFIHLRMRDPDERIGRDHLWAVFVVWMGLAVYLGLKPGSLRNFLLYYVTPVLAYVTAHKVWGRWKDRLIETAEQFCVLGFRSSQDTLILRVAADEASAVLSAARLFSWFSQKAHQAATWLGTTLGPIIVLIAAVLAVPVAIGSFFMVGPLAPLVVLVFLAYSFLFVALTLCITLLPFAAMMLVTGLLFGSDGALS